MTNEQPTIELEFEVQEAWGLGVCTCCSNSYLLRLMDGRFLYLDSWRLTPFAEPETFPKRNLSLMVDPHNNVVLSVTTEGPMVPKGVELLDRVAESELTSSEYCLMKGSDLPSLWRRALNAA